MIPNTIYSKSELRKYLKKLNIDDIDLYSIYTGYTRQDILTSLYNGKHLHSFMRSDSTPSLGFYIGDNGTIRFKDFGGDGGDVFTVANIHHRKALQGGLFVELLQAIYNDVLKKNNYTVSKEQITLLPKQKVTVDVDLRDWSNYDYQYWVRGYDFDSLEEVEYYSTYAVDIIYLNGKFYKKSSPKFPIYGYLVTMLNGDFFWKCYLPKQTPKFITGGIGLDFMPYVLNDLKPTDPLGLIKSRKDAMVVYDHIQTLLVPNSENSTGMSKQELGLFKNRRVNTYIEQDEGGLIGISQLETNLGKTVTRRLLPSTGDGNKQINDFAELRKFLRKDKFKEFCQWYFPQPKLTLTEIHNFINKLKH